VERGHEDFHIARFHNVYGPYGTWDGGREKSPGGHLPQGGQLRSTRKDLRIKIWGDGHQNPQFHWYIRRLPWKGIDMITHCDDLIATPIKPRFPTSSFSINDLVFKKWRTSQA